MQVYFQSGILFREEVIKVKKNDAMVWLINTYDRTSNIRVECERSVQIHQ